MSRDETRAEVIRRLESIPSIESLDKYATEEEGDVLVIAVSSAYSTEDRLADDAWDAARELSSFWSDDSWKGVGIPEGWWPKLRLSVNEVTWNCPGEAMRALAQRASSRSEWMDACGG